MYAFFIDFFYIHGIVSWVIRMKKYSSEIEKLQETARTEKLEITEMSRFCAYPEQNVAACIHPSAQFGAYHVHDFFEINYVQKGSCINFVEGQTVFMEEGSLIWMHTGTFHTLYAPRESVIYNFLLRKEWFYGTVCHYPPPDTPAGQFASEAQETTYPRYLLYDPAPQNVRKAAEKLYGDKAENPLLLESDMLILAVALLESVCGKLSAVRGTSDEAMLRMLSYISAQYDTVTLGGLAAEVGYSATHVCRLFKKNLGKSFGEVVGEIRLRHAENLLLHTKRTVADIAESVGFESPEHFSRLFKKRMGKSPGRYRTEKVDINKIS